MVRKKEQYKFPCPFCGDNNFGFHTAQISEKALGEKTEKPIFIISWKCLICKNIFSESKDYEGEYNRIYPLAKDAKGQLPELFGEES